MKSGISRRKKLVIESFSNRLEETPHTIAVRYIKTIGRAVAGYINKTSPIDQQIAHHKSEIEKLQARREKFKPRITKLARNFRAFAEQYRSQFLTSRTKSVKTTAGDFCWAYNPEGLIFQDELAVIRELIRLDRLDLLRMELKKLDLAAALKAGHLKMKTVEVGRRERFVIEPIGQLPVTVCGEDPVRIGKEKIDE